MGLVCVSIRLFEWAPLPFATDPIAQWPKPCPWRTLTQPGTSPSTTFALMRILSFGDSTMQ
jgi:hypothetical protein